MRTGQVLFFNFLPGTVISSNGVAAVQTLAVGGVNSGGSIPEAGATVHAKGDLTVNGNAQGSTRSIFIYSGTDAGGKRNLLQIDGNLTATRTGGLYGAVIENTGGDLLVAGKTSLTSNVSDALRNGWDANSTFRGSTSINVSGSNGIRQSGGTVNFNGDLTINTITGNGITTSGGVLNARELYIDVKSGVGNGIAISDRGIVNISGGKIITEGKGSTAISLNGGAFSSTDALSILTKSNDSQGIVLSGDAKAILARTDIQTQGDNANGINIINTPTNGVTLYFQDAISIETLGGGSNAIASKNNPANGFVLPAGSMLVTQGENSHGIDMQIESGGGDLTVFELASGANIETHGKNASALFISNDDGEVNIKTASKIIASGAGSDGIEIDSALRGANIINTGEISASDIGINFNTGVQGNVFNAGTISSDNNIAVHFADEINTLTLTSGSQIKGSVLGGAFDDSLILQGTNSEDLSKFNDFNKLVMEGDEWTLNDNGIFSDSYTQKSGVVNLVGTLVTPQVNVEGGTLNLWKSQTWDTLINGGKISLNTTGNVGNTLNVKGDYNGSNGVLVFNTALGSDHSLSDKLVIYGNAMGTTSVVVNNVGGTGAQTVEGIQVVQVDGASSGTFALTSPVQAGSYEYQLFQGGTSTPTDGDWYLRSTLLACEITNTCPVVPPVEPEPPVIPIYRPGVANYVVAQTSNADLGYLALDTLHQRIGEQRTLTTDNPQTWVRAIAGYTSNNGKNRFEYDQTTVGFQIGRDLLHDTTGSGTQQRAGLTTQYLRGNVDTRDRVRPIARLSEDTGHIQSTAYGLGAYYTRMTNQGAYVDLVAQVNRLDNQFNDAYGSSSKQKGWQEGLSAEVGKPVAQIKGWTLEPQAQLSYLHAHYGAFADQFSKISSLNTDHLRARLGLRVYKERHPDSSKTAQYYAIANIHHDLISPESVELAALNSEDRVGVSERYDRTSWEVGAGVQHPLSKNTYFYGDARYEQSFGDRKHSGKITFGIKSSF